MADARQRLRRLALDGSAALWSIGPGRRADVRRPADDELRLLRDALQAAQVTGRVAVVGPGPAAMAAARAVGGVVHPDLTTVPAGEPVVLAGVLERRPAHRVRPLLEGLRGRPLVAATLPLWPAGRAAGGRTLRTRAWWEREAARAGLEPVLELRRDAAGVEALVLAPREASPPPPAPPRTAPPRRDVAVRINDPLSLGSSFAFVSGAIALALEDLGIPVSIAPTTVSALVEPERRERLERLIERRGAPGTPDVELGWTHFWPEYRRELGGRLPLALFAINYAFRRRDPAGFDPWFGGLVAGRRPVAPISTFCQDVLVDAGLARELTHVVPMGYTDGVERAAERPLPHSRGLKVLHVTNAADLERNGTDLALDAFEAAFGPEADVTLVVRDYGSWSADVAGRAERLQARGYDVRYWPVFLAQARLGSLLGAFDVLLAPFRGEGFGIKVLDAMACGVAPIAPAFGGPRDFLSADSAIEVPHELVPVEAGYDADALALGNDPVWARCDHAALVAALRAAHDDRPGLAARGAAARERALGRFSWHDTARRVAELAATPH